MERVFTGKRLLFNQQLVKLMDNLKRGYLDVLGRAKFLSPEAKKHAVDKANDVHTFIAADAWVMDDNKLNEYYKTVSFG